MTTRPNHSDMGPTITRFTLLAACALALCVAQACGDDGGADVSANNNGVDNNGVDNNGVDNNDAPDVIEDNVDVPEEAGPDTADGTLDAPSTDDAAPPQDVEDDVMAMEDVAPDLPPMEDVEEDLPPLEPRPEVLTGGISLVESTIEVIPFFVAIRRGSAVAAFVEPSEDPPPLDTFGACDALTFDADAQNNPFGYDAGELTLSDGVDTVTLSPQTGEDDSVTYTNGLPEDNDILFPPGSEITIQGSGGRHIRPINGVITTPDAHTVTSPGADSTIGAGPLEVAWTGAGSQAQVIMTLTPHNNAYQFIDGVALSCVIDGDPGAFTVPAEAIAAMGAPQRIGIAVIKLVNTEVQAGDDTFLINATYAGGNMVQFSP